MTLNYFKFVAVIAKSARSPKINVIFASMIHQMGHLCLQGHLVVCNAILDTLTLELPQMVDNYRLDVLVHCCKDTRAILGKN